MAAICAEPGCPVILPKPGRCALHRKARDAERGRRQTRGYDAAFDQTRRAYQVRMDTGELFRCWRCHGLIDPTDWHLGHDDHDRTVIRGPEHPGCNLAVARRRR